MIVKTSPINRLQFYIVNGDLLRACQGGVEGVAVGGAAPVGGGAAVVDVGAEHELADHRDRGVQPGQREHQAHAQQRRHQAHPLVVVLERWAPTAH